MKHAILSLALIATPVMAEETADLGTLNPDEMTWGNNIARAARGEVDMTICASGYMLTKSGDHANARIIFQACAAAGYTGAITWSSQLANNGLGGDYNPDAAAELGDPVGKFNYGIDLMRGVGIAHTDPGCHPNIVAQRAPWQKRRFLKDHPGWPDQRNGFALFNA